MYVCWGASGANQQKNKTEQLPELIDQISLFFCRVFMQNDLARNCQEKTVAPLAAHQKTRDYIATPNNTSSKHRQVLSRSSPYSLATTYSH